MIFLRSQIKIEDVESKVEKKFGSKTESNTTNVFKPEIKDNQAQTSSTDINESQNVF